MRDKAWWKELSESLGMRSVFHGLCEYEGDDVGADILDFVGSRPWVRELKDRFAAVAAFDSTMPCENGNDELLETLFQLYATSRVRDVLILGRQPETIAAQSEAALDQWLNCSEPMFATLPLDEFEAFFAKIGCRSETVTAFDPICHEIVVCEAADDPDSEIVVVEQLWATLLIGEMVFARAGVRVRAGASRAMPGVADRSPLHSEYWRRYRRTHDASMGWGSNSQWATLFRRDYLTDRGAVFNIDAGETWRMARAAQADDDGLTAPELAELVTNRCLLRHDRPNEFFPRDIVIDEQSRTGEEVDSF